ncbi:MAG: GNAT family acetyltransferase [Pseudomonadota bacterium]
MQIRPYQDADESAVLALWQTVGLTAPQNNPRLDIQRKLADSPELFLVGVKDNVVVATAMGGYDGHRGWVSYLAVAPGQQQSGLGRKMMQTLEALLVAQGCPKINLQVRESNPEAIRFYHSLGYTTDSVISLGKRLVEDEV